MIDGITFTALDKIESDAGSVLHFIKNDDPGYIGFGEIYFSILFFINIKLNIIFLTLY